MSAHHIPQLIAHLASLGRHAITYGHVGTRALVSTFLYLQSPRDAFRVALGQSRLPDKAETRNQSKKTPFFIHYHIFKNAGSSFEWALQEVFGKKFRQYDSPEPGGHVSAMEIARLSRCEPHLCAISSHQAMPPAPRIRGRKVLTSILIRDPIARIGSIYAFERLQPEATPGSRQAKKLDFEGYVRWRLETSPSLICNYQVSVCSGEGKARDCTRRDLEAAIIRLDGIDIVGTVRRYRDWLVLAQSVLEQSFGPLSLNAVHHNQSLGKPLASEAETLRHLLEHLGPTLTYELLARNELDMCLHEVAEALLTRRLAERSVKVTLRDVYSEALPNGRESGLRP